MGSYVIYQIYRGVSVFISIISYALLAYCVMSWVASPQNRLYQFLARFAEPILYPFRLLMDRLLRRPLPFDISPILAMVALNILQSLLGRLLFSLF